jgi:hypothetical protein
MRIGARVVKGSDLEVPVGGVEEEVATRGDLAGLLRRLALIQAVDDDGIVADRGMIPARRRGRLIVEVAQDGTAADGHPKGQALRVGGSVVAHPAQFEVQRLLARADGEPSKPRPSEQDRQAGGSPRRRSRPGHLLDLRDERVGQRHGSGGPCQRQHRRAGELPGRGGVGAGEQVVEPPFNLAEDPAVRGRLALPPVAIVVEPARGELAHPHPRLADQVGVVKEPSDGQQTAINLN